MLKRVDRDRQGLIVIAAVVSSQGSSWSWAGS